MKSYTTLLSLYQKFTNNVETANQTFGASNINDSIRTIYNMRGGTWWFLFREWTVLTTALQEWVKIPNNVRKLSSVRVRVSAIPYLPTPVFDSDLWNLILLSKLAASDIPIFYRRVDNKMYFQPAPLSTGNEVIMSGRLQTPDLGIADYTTGTIQSIANGATTVTGVGTSWTAGMEGMYIRITKGTAANLGDGEWYRVASITDSTHLELELPYEGDSIAAGTAAYTLGQMSLIPEAYDIAPVYRAAALYWMQKDQAKAKYYWNLYDGGFEAGYQSVCPNGLIGQMLDSESGTVEAAYISPFGEPYIDPNTPQQTLATGIDP